MQKAAFELRTTTRKEVFLRRSKSGKWPPYLGEGELSWAHGVCVRLLKNKAGQQDRTKKRTKRSIATLHRVPLLYPRHSNFISARWWIWNDIRRV